MPPVAFQTKNVHQRMRETPASNAAVTRRTEKKRAMKIVFGPWRSKKPSAHGSEPAVSWKRVSTERPPVRPIQ